MQIEGEEYSLVIPSEYPSLYRQGDRVYQFTTAQETSLFNMLEAVADTGIPAAGVVEGLQDDIAQLQGRLGISPAFTYETNVVEGEGGLYQLHFRCLAC